MALSACLSSGNISFVRHIGALMFTASIELISLSSSCSSMAKWLTPAALISRLMPPMFWARASTSRRSESNVRSARIQHRLLG
ncbi:hypothetical protein D3C85_1493020 [compost metagenome]